MGKGEGDNMYTKIAWKNLFVHFLVNNCIARWKSTKKAYHTNMVGCETLASNEKIGGGVGEITFKGTCMGYISGQRFFWLA
jgi:hypothetical protein